jgi:hypothetical protein
MTKHTPGPWFHEERFDEDGETSLGLAVYAGRDEVARLPGIGRKDIKNARLIAAAPMLVDALRDLLESCTQETAPDGYRILQTPRPSAAAKASAAIKKATGEQT